MVDPVDHHFPQVFFAILDHLRGIPNACDTVCVYICAYNLFWEIWLWYDLCVSDRDGLAYTLLMLLDPVYVSNAKITGGKDGWVQRKELASDGLASKGNDHLDLQLVHPRTTKTTRTELSHHSIKQFQYNFCIYIYILPNTSSDQNKHKLLLGVWGPNRENQQQKTDSIRHQSQKHSATACELAKPLPLV